MEENAGDTAGAPKELETKASESTTNEESKPVVDEGDVPDPDEDDLDDLDDMLDEFSAVKVTETKQASSEPNPPRAQVPDASAEDVLSDDEFTKQLQAGMAELMGGLENSAEVQAQLESIFKELGAAAAAPGGGPATSEPSRESSAKAPSGPSTAGAGTEASFQETIRRTMERMQTSGDQATAAAAADEGTDDFMAELLKQMQTGGLDGEGGAGGEEEFSKMLMGMMEQLTNKDILYEPMKELHDKFPEWMEKNGAMASEEDRTRYGTQQVLVKEIVAKFEESTYSDSNADDREYIVDRMQKMQAAGSPPPDLVGDMPSAQEVMGAPEESCNPQ